MPLRVASAAPSCPLLSIFSLVVGRQARWQALETAPILFPVIHTTFARLARYYYNRIIQQILLMDFDEYQQKAFATAIYPHPIVYPTLGLTGEAGEVADKVKKVIRDNQGEFGDERRLEIAKEIGDVLWYCAMLAHDLGYTFEQIAQINCDKIAARKNAGTIHGEGDNR